MRLDYFRAPIVFARLEPHQMLDQENANLVAF